MVIGNPSYPSYQVFLALFASGALTALLMPLWIKVLTYRHIGQQVRADGPHGHLIKQGTPTMGGVVMLVVLTLTCILFARLTPDLYLVLGTTLFLGILGFIDDISKVAYERSLGLTPTAKLIGQGILTTVFCLVAVNVVGIEPVVKIPGAEFAIDLGILSTSFAIAGVQVIIPWLYLIFVFLLMAGFSNAVNLTDGLDGLAAGTVFIAMGVMAMIAYRYDELSLAIFSAACAGTCVGFLWFNSHPADIFMGDTGSLALGAAFASMALLTNSEVISLIVGLLFILEALSVIIQVVVFKLTRKRVFLMAPLHHHFEKLGWSESKVVIRFWIITAASAALGFAIYFQLS